MINIINIDAMQGDPVRLSSRGQSPVHSLEVEQQLCLSTLKLF